MGREREYVEAIILAVYTVLEEFLDYRMGGYDSASLPPGAYRVAEIVDDVYRGKADEEDVKEFIKGILGGILYPKFVAAYRRKFPWLDEEIAPGRFF